MVRLPTYLTYLPYTTEQQVKSTRGGGATYKSKSKSSREL